MLKIDCRSALKLLSDYLDDELSADVREAIQQHLTVCHRCTVVFDTTRQTLQIVSSVEPFEVPVDVRSRLDARLREVMNG